MKNQTLLIYNPHAGTKRKILPSSISPVSLEDVKELLGQYQIPVDYKGTKYSGHATELAKKAVAQGYKSVIVAGGDGTVGEVANGLVGSDVTLGIIPLGSFMNVARMLSIPTELEKAVAVLKIGRSRKIDIGQISFTNKKGYFLESAGLGLEAQLHQYVLNLEEGNKIAFFKILKTFFEYYSHKTTLTIDKKIIKTRAILITISNGPYTGVSLPIAPKAKLNDHRLTVSIFKMTRWELLNYLFRLLKAKKRYSPKVVTFQAKKVKIDVEAKRIVHADARIYGTTPVEFEIIPNALNVITGFPKRGEAALVKRTYLD